MNNLPMIFHVTHIKSGSQWVAEILKYSAPERVVLPQPQVGHILRSPLAPGAVYPAVYLSRPQLGAVLAATPHPHRTFVVLRDLRDTLISLFFSLKMSHTITNPFQQHLREQLARMDEEQGLLLLIGREDEQPMIRELMTLPIPELYQRLTRSEAPVGAVMEQIADIQTSWIRSDDVLLVRYEDLLADEHAVFERIIDYCEIDVSREHLHAIIGHNTFEAVTGRRPGQEDPAAHQRKGIAGDWRNHFTDRVKDAFKGTFGAVLLQTGYEQGGDW